MKKINLKQLSLEDLRNSGLIIYEYIRGSVAYNLNTETSDTDIGGVYIAPIDKILGLPSYYQKQVSDERNDVTFYELGTYIELLMKSNPNAIESLYIPKDKIIGDAHPSLNILFENREAFITKKLINSLLGYAYTQIGKARGLNKKIVNPVVDRKGVIDFCYTPKNQGSTNILKWLENMGLNQKFCGLAAIPNMKDMYSVYYDWNTHARLMVNPTNSEISSFMGAGEKLGAWPEPLNYMIKWKEVLTYPSYGYKGIVKDTEDDNFNESNEVRLSSIMIDAKPICFMSYNKDGYITHCKKYREYKDWEKQRNPVRYESNLEKNYDAKNMSHTVRLIHMCIEVLKGEGFKVERTHDRQFLLDIKNHKYEYDYLVQYAENKKYLIESLLKDCVLPDDINEDICQEILVNIRKEIEK